MFIERKIKDYSTLREKFIKELEKELQKTEFDKNTDDLRKHLMEQRKKEFL